MRQVPTQTNRRDRSRRRYGFGDVADRGVRQAAARNLGALAALSARATALEADAAVSRAAEVFICSRCASSFSSSASSS
jgi:hypothetical protein